LPQLHKSAALGLPEKYVYAILPISFLLMGIHAIVNFLRNCSRPASAFEPAAPGADASERA
jgi:TRAP-type C4-dicarboxylate transport system permease small subunit